LSKEFNIENYKLTDEQLIRWLTFISKTKEILVKGLIKDHEIIEMLKAVEGK